VLLDMQNISSEPELETLRYWHRSLPSSAEAGCYRLSRLAITGTRSPVGFARISAFAGRGYCWYR
jgi:hypothetical protein